MTTLGLDYDKNGIASVIDSRFEKTTFSDMTIAPPKGKQVSLKNVEFCDCAVSPGSCAITSNVELEDVSFVNFDCGDALRISSEAILKRVVISGTSPLELIVRPETEDGFKMQPVKDDFQIDISDFQGSVSIIGLHGHGIRKDRTRHVTVKSSWEDIDWSRIGIGPFSYWRIYLKKLTVFKVSEGVFSLPTRADKNYAETMVEKAALEAAGVNLED